ncbi:MAG: HAMP domain-containing histidine kinase [Oscillospiraceae bacterium]|nr:HAMP domain-containing histidine kinase [Oscillospiraceae bacterium]
MIVLAGIVAYSISIYSYYYSGMEAGLRMKAKTATDIFANYITKTYAEYYQSAYRYTERFDERDKLELQFISTAGRVEVSTYGITAGSRPGTPDIGVAQETHTIALWHGRNPSTGERIISVTSPMLYSDGRMVGMMRYVSSMQRVDHLVLLNIFAASGIGAAILALMAGASLFFIRSIIAPIQEVTSMTRAIADGGYGAQIENKYDDEIGEMVNSINEMSMKISQSEKMKTEFISSVSHELRTPLTAIAGWGETLLYGEGLSEDSKRGLHIILKEARRLATMVEELLDFTRIEDGKFTVRLEPCDVEIVLEDAVATYAEVFRQDGLKLSYEPLEEPLAEIPGDPVRLKQVFLNILDNAAKYGREGKMIEIATGVVSDGAKEWVCIAIRDYGPGIPEDDLEQVKLKFYKGSSKERGSGIGLAVCDEIVRRHSGRLTLENAIGGGVEVTVLLPKPSSVRKNEPQR